MTTPRNRPSVRLPAPAKPYDVAGLPTRYFNPGELETLLYLFESVAPKVIVEIGVNNGRNPAAALRNFPDLVQYVGVDVPPGYAFKMAVQKNEVPQVPGQLALHDPRFKLLLRRRGSFDLSASELPSADAVFIDGDHSREAVLNDYSLARSIVRRGGIIIFHDDNGSDRVEVTPTLNALCDEGAPIQHVADTWLSFERR